MPMNRNLIARTLFLGVMFASVGLDRAASGAQQAAAPTATPLAAPAFIPACDGMLAIIRTMEINPGSNVDRFMAAVAAQTAWYGAHGLKDRVFASKMLVRESDKVYGYSDKTVMSYHFYAPGTTLEAPAHDPEWDKFVKMFEEAATVKESAYTCIPANALTPLAK